MNKMKKKIKKVDSNAVRDKEQQHPERTADNVVDRHSNQFPNFMALTKDEKLAFFESLHYARKNVMDRGNKIKECFGTVHDEYLKYFGNVEDNEGSENFKDSSETLECSGTYESVSNSLQSESSRSNYSAIPRRTMTKPVETIFIHMNMFTNSSTPSIMSSKKFQESKSLLSKDDEDRENGGSRKKQTQTKSPKRKRPHDDNSDKIKKKSSSRFVTKLPKLKKRESSKAQKEERNLEASTSNKSQFETLKSDEKEIFFSTLKEVRDNILKESPEKDDEIASMKDIMKMYETPKEAASTKIKVPRRKETCIKGNIKGKTNSLRVKMVITSSESERTKKERVSKRKERSRKSEKERVEGEKEKTKKGEAVRVENYKKSKDTERKLVHSSDGSEKKQQRQDNSTVTTRKPKENKKKNAKAQKKGDSIKESEEVCQDKRNEEERKVLGKTDKSVIKNLSGKQEKKKILASRRRIQKDKPKEKAEKLKKEERSPKSEQVEQDTQYVVVEEEKQEEQVTKEVKEDLRSSRCMTEAISPPTEAAEIVKTEEEAIETFLFVNKFKSTKEARDEGKGKTEVAKTRENEPEDSLSSESSQNEFGEKEKCLKAENVNDKSATLSTGTTDEEITIEVEEHISVMKAPLSVKSEVRHQPEETELDVKRKKATEKSKSMTLELRLEEEALDDCYARKGNSHVVTSDEDSVHQLWEELKLSKLSDSDCVMKTESMSAQMKSETASQSWFSFLSKKSPQSKVHLAEENLIVIGNENKTQKGGERREAEVLDLLKSEGVIMVDGDAVEKIKNLVESLEKGAETKGGTKLEVKPDKKNLENEYSQLLLEYIDYLTRLLYMLTNKREQKSKTWVRAPLTARSSHPEFVQNKNKKSECIEKPRFLSNPSLPEDMKTEAEVKAKKSTVQDSEVEGNPISLLTFSDSPTTVSSCEDDVSLATTLEARKKLIEDFLRERAKFVEESIDGFRIIKMASRGCGVDCKFQDREIEQNKTKFKFFHIFSRFCKCIRKEGSEEDQVKRKQQRTEGEEDH